MSTTARFWTRAAAELYSSRFPNAHMALGIFRKHRLRDGGEVDPVLVRPSKRVNGYEIVVEYENGERRTYAMLAGDGNESAPAQDRGATGQQARCRRERSPFKNAGGN